MPIVPTLHVRKGSAQPTHVHKLTANHLRAQSHVFSYLIDAQALHEPQVVEAVYLFFRHSHTLMMAPATSAHAGARMSEKPIVSRITPTMTNSTFHGTKISSRNTASAVVRMSKHLVVDLLIIDPKILECGFEVFILGELTFTETQVFSYGAKLF